MSADTIDSATLPLAVLIDGDNAQPSLIEDVLAEAAKHGDVIIRRIYGDWTTKELSGWKDYINSHAITPMQQFRNTVGKNSTDSAMIIDAMEILHSKDVRGFCLVSSDSDYTSLAIKIREKGLFVMGIACPPRRSPLERRVMYSYTRKTCPRIPNLCLGPSSRHIPTGER